jgi:excisionase family DNA binding protein
MRDKPQDSVFEIGIGKLLTAKQLSDMLQVPVSWVYQKTRDQVLPVIKVGKHYRYDCEEVLDALSGESQKRAGREFSNEEDLWQK